MSNSTTRPVKTTVAIAPDDYEWLKRHPQYSISGLLTWAIKYHRAMEKKQMTIDTTF